MAKIIKCVTLIGSSKIIFTNVKWQHVASRKCCLDKKVRKVFVFRQTIQEAKLKLLKKLQKTSHVITNMQNGWPVRSCPSYHQVRNELSAVDGRLLKQDKIVIPQSQREDMLNKIHQGHAGVEKSKR